MAHKDDPSPGSIKVKELKSISDYYIETIRIEDLLSHIQNKQIMALHLSQYKEIKREKL